jgi:hypothetical protein
MSMPPEYHFLMIFQEGLADLLSFPVWSENPPDLSARLGLALSPQGLHLWDLGRPSDTTNLDGLSRRFSQELDEMSAANKRFLAFHVKQPQEFWTTWESVRFLIDVRYVRLRRFVLTPETPPLFSHWHECLAELVVEDRQGNGVLLAGVPQGPAVRFFLNPQTLSLRTAGMIDKLLGPTLRRRALVLPPSIDRALPPASDEGGSEVVGLGVESFRWELVRRGGHRPGKPAAVTLLDMTAEPLLQDFWLEGGRCGFLDRPDGFGRQLRIQPAQCSSNATPYRRTFIYADEQEFFGESVLGPLPDWLAGLRDAVRHQAREWRDRGQLGIEETEGEPCRPARLPGRLFQEMPGVAQAATDFLLWLGESVKEVAAPSNSSRSLSDRGGPAIGVAAWLFAPALFPAAVGGELWRLGLPETGAAFFRALHRLLSEDPPNDVVGWMRSVLGDFLAGSGLVAVNASGQPANDWQFGETELEPPQGGDRVASLFLAVPSRDSWLRAVPLLHLLCPLECRILAGCQPWLGGIDIPGPALAGLDLDESRQPRGLGYLLPR